MTPSQKESLEQKNKITLNDLTEFDWYYDEAIEGDTEWIVRGNVSSETRQGVFDLLEKNDYDPETCGWGEESDSGYILMGNNGGLMFDQ